MPTIKNILYASDLSENSAYAYQYALSFAEQYDAMITIVHIIEDMGPWAKSVIEEYLPPGHRQKIMQEVTEHIKSRIQTFCDTHAREYPDCPLRVRSIKVYEGNPGVEILKQATDLEADMIVLASHGRGSAMQPFFGNVARRIVAHTRVPVVVVPIPDDPGMTFTEI